ncbi:MAG: hypothetical protein ACLUFV_00435 [Acutalibacteraceae bacterium]
MKLTSEMVKAKAAELGIDCIAIGNIERFRGAPKLMSPLTYFPEARSVIAVAMRIRAAPTAASRRARTGTTTRFIPITSSIRFSARRSRTTSAVSSRTTAGRPSPHPAVPEGNGTTREPVAADKVPPDVVCSVRVIAAGCGLGEIGFSRSF